MAVEMKRIYVIEDDINERVNLRLVLSGLPVQVIFDTWGYDTLRQMQDHAPLDLILLDISTDRAADQYASIRAVEAFRDTPTAALSQAATLDIIDCCRTYGLVGLLLKPVDAGLADAITRLLNGESLW
ncbi:MAG: response regulator [bacterium]|nr:response regulator [bacterium]